MQTYICAYKLVSQTATSIFYAEINITVINFIFILNVFTELDITQSTHINTVTKHV